MTCQQLSLDCQQPMAAISVRGLDDGQLAALKEQARREGISLNRRVRERLNGQTNRGGDTHDDQVDGLQVIRS